MKFHTLTMVTTILVLTLSGCTGTKSTNKAMSAAVDDALRPQAAPADIRAWLSAGAQNVGQLEPWGKNNLTYFILTNKDELKEYAISFEGVTPELIKEKIDKDLSAVTVEDLVDLQYGDEKAGTIEGSFSIDMNYGVKATFLFRGESKAEGFKITTLVIAKVGSISIADGHPVFSL